MDAIVTFADASDARCQAGPDRPPSSPQASIMTNTALPDGPLPVVSALSLPQADREIWAAIDAEQHRQRHSIELIASENFASRAVLDTQGSVLTNKYAEGYSGRRYYGCLLYTSPSPRD